MTLTLPGCVEVTAATTFVELARVAVGCGSGGTLAAVTVLGPPAPLPSFGSLQLQGGHPIAHLPCAADGSPVRVGLEDLSIGVARSFTITGLPIGAVLAFEVL